MSCSRVSTDSNSTEALVRKWMRKWKNDAVTAQMVQGKPLLSVIAGNEKLGIAQVTRAPIYGARIFKNELEIRLFTAREDTDVVVPVPEGDREAFAAIFGRREEADACVAAMKWVDELLKKKHSSGFL